MSRFAWITVAVFLAVTALACGKKEEPPQVKKPVTEKEVQQEGKEALDTLKAFADQQKEAYQKKIADHLAEMQKKMEELKGQVDKASPELKARLNQELEEAKQNIGTLQKNLEDVKTATGKVWEDMKGNLNQTLQDWQKGAEKPGQEGK